MSRLATPRPNVRGKKRAWACVSTPKPTPESGEVHPPHAKTPKYHKHGGEPHAYKQKVRHTIPDAMPRTRQDQSQPATESWTLGETGENPTLQTVSTLPPLHEVHQLQMFVPSAEYIQKISVLEIQTPADLSHPLLGVTDTEEACQSCDNFLVECPGHYGHIHLPEPVYMIFYVRQLIDVLNCVCFYCQNLRIRPDHSAYTTIQALPPHERLEALTRVCSSIRRCGNEQETCPPTLFQQVKQVDQQKCCGKLHIQFRREDKDAIFIQAVVHLETHEDPQLSTQKDWSPPQFGPTQIHQVLSLLSEETRHMLGITPDNDPVNMCWTNLVVPPHTTRPAHRFRQTGGIKKQFHSGWNRYLQTILQQRDYLLQAKQSSHDAINICIYNFRGVESHDFKECFEFGYTNKEERQKHTKRFKTHHQSTDLVPGRVEQAWRDLSYAIAAFHSYKHKKYAQRLSHFNGRIPDNCEERYRKQKRGRFRANIIARRGDFMMRFVLDGDIHIRPDQIVLPMSEAMHLTRRIHVNAYNMKELYQYVLNGPFTYPGANHVMLKTGEEIDLSQWPNRRDIDMNTVWFVRRHLLAGDTFLANRAPTLHRLSMFALSAIIRPSYAGFLHPSVFLPLGADCDGDEINLFDPQDIEAVVEMIELVALKDAIMKDGRLWIKFIQNAVNGLCALSHPHVRLRKDQACQLLMVLESESTKLETESTKLESPSLVLPDPAGYNEQQEPYWSGPQMVSSLLPTDFTLHLTTLRITRGQLQAGQWTDTHLNGPQHILCTMYRNYPHERSVQFLHQGYLMGQMYLNRMGHSAGYYDCVVDVHDLDLLSRNPTESDTTSETAESELLPYLERIQHVQQRGKVTEAYIDSICVDQPGVLPAPLERHIGLHIQKYTQMISDAYYDYFAYKHTQQNSGLMQSMLSGASGSKTTLQQMSGVVGQIYVLYQRFSEISSHWKHGQHQMRARGFIPQCYSEGLSITAMISEAHATCESTIMKNKGTAKSGYTVRKLSTCLQGLVVDYLGRALDTQGRVLWDTYGNDGYIGTHLQPVSQRLCQLSWWDWLARVVVMTRWKDWRQLTSRTLRGKGSQWRAQWGHTIETTASSTPTTLPGATVVLPHTTFHEDEPWVETWRPFQAHTLPEVWQRWSQRCQQYTIREGLNQDALYAYALYGDIQQLYQRTTQEMGHTIRVPCDMAQLFHRCQQEVPPTNQVDMDPWDYTRFRQELWQQLIKQQLVAAQHKTWEGYYLDWFATTHLITTWHFGWDQLRWLGRKLIEACQRSRIHVGESVGTDASQSLGEVFTQLSLKTPQLNGNFPTLLAGSARVEALVDGTHTHPSMRICLRSSILSESDAIMYGMLMTHTQFKDIWDRYPAFERQAQQIHIYFYLSREKCMRRLVPVRQIALRMSRLIQLNIAHFQCPFLDEHHIPLTLRCTIPLQHDYWSTIRQQIRSPITWDVESLVDHMIQNTASLSVAGLPAITNFVVEPTKIGTRTGIQNRWSLVTLGSALASVLRFSCVDAAHTTCNDIQEIQQVLGLHAARKALEGEFLTVMSGVAETRHVKLITRAMISQGHGMGMKISQYGKALPPLQRASYERAFEQLTEACTQAEMDPCATICGAALAGKRMNVGTGFSMELIQPTTSVPIPRTPTNVPPTTQAHYSWSHKVDGERMMLSFLMDRNQTRHVVLTNRKQRMFQFHESLHTQLPLAWFHGTILDGDLTRFHDGSIVFVAYDLLLCCGNTCAILRKDQRMELLRHLVQQGTPQHPYPILQQLQKETFVLPTTYPHTQDRTWTCGDLPFTLLVKTEWNQEALPRMAQHYHQNLPYPHDGYILTHLAAPALPFRTFAQGIFKWKPRHHEWDENTIDFVVVPRQPHSTLGLWPALHQPYHQTKHWNAFRRQNGTHCLMMPLQDTPHQQPLLWCFSMAHLAIELPTSTYTHVVGEAQWNHTTKQWTVIRWREKDANQVETVSATLKNIQEDVTMEIVLQHLKM